MSKLNLAVQISSATGERTLRRRHARAVIRNNFVCITFWGGASHGISDDFLGTEIESRLLVLGSKVLALLKRSAD